MLKHLKIPFPDKKQNENRNLPGGCISIWTQRINMEPFRVFLRSLRKQYGVAETIIRCKSFTQVTHTQNKKKIRCNAPHGNKTSYRDTCIMCNLFTKKSRNCWKLRYYNRPYLSTQEPGHLTMLLNSALHWHCLSTIHKTGVIVGEKLSSFSTALLEEDSNKIKENLGFKVIVLLKI